MSPSEFQHVTIIGVGLIGGSLGLAIRARNPRVEIAGVGRRKRSLDAALAAGAIDTAHLDAGEVAGQSDLIVLATPVGAFERHLRTIAPVLRNRAIVTDVGSTKAAVVRAARRVLGPKACFVGSHPMVGSERKGVRFAEASLFDGATCIITPIAQTPPAATGRVEKLWRLLGMRVVRLTPAAHDKAMARISHLPHALASLLVLLAKKADLDVSASGFRDTTRLASGDAELWRDIFMTNRKAILAAIDEFDEAMCHLRDLIQLGDAPGIEKFLATAKKRRNALRAR